MLLGHLVGDYLLQNKWMALMKSKNTKMGWLAAIIHCVLYTASVCLIMWNFDPIWIGAVFASHFFIDKFGLANIYIEFIRGRNLKRFVKESWEADNYHILKGGFTTFVYAVTDNTMHLLLMWGAYQIIY